MTHPIVYVLARNCVVSPLNVRTQSDPDADAELDALIGQTGYVIQNLIGVAVKGKKDQYSIFGGGRRLTRVQKLMDDGKLPEDFLVPVMVLPNTKDAIALSLIENQKLPMTPAEECVAYCNMIEKERKTLKQVAVRFGKSERFVEGRIRLAKLAEPVFEAFRKGEITIEIAQAYGSSPDRDRQAAAFNELNNGHYSPSANEIRRYLAAGTYLGGDPKALLVGRESYRAAGGRIDVDLYTTEATERWIDGPILDRLVNEKLAEAAEAIHDREGFAEVRVLPATHVTYDDTFGLTPVQTELPPLAPEQAARCEEIKAALQAIAQTTAEEDSDGVPQDDESRRNDLHAEYRSIIDRMPVLSDEQKASAVAYVMIGHDGQPRLHRQFYAAPSTEPESDSVPKTPAAGDKADATNDSGQGKGPRKPVISQRLADELATMKAELLRIHIASDPRFALDLGTFCMADKARETGGGSELATELRADQPTSRVPDFRSETHAAEAWMKLDAALDRSWTGHADVRDRYDAFRALPEEARAAWLGWAIARTIRSVPAGDIGSAFIDHLGTVLEIDVATWWRPTARNYFDRIGRAAILDQFEAIGGVELRQRYGASKKHELAGSAEKLFAGQMHMTAADKERALAWVPDAMRFVHDEPSVHSGGGLPDEEAGDPELPDSNEETLLADAA